ncbi:cyclin-K-like isoform X2 [Siniperca chuatsi]|uniref:cyclin-K-like isoform X2 n=1 Tax=Siniperca chuatsi TaxID=119488 RepID=UPI001CE11966|nr:cyclin-K-like isoform X2 [Siniperca chuatsi]
MNVKFIFAAPPRRQKILSGEAYLVHSKRIYSNSDQYVAALYKVVGTFLFGAAVSQSLTDYSVHSSFGMYCMLFLALHPKLCREGTSQKNWSVHPPASLHPPGLPKPPSSVHPPVSVHPPMSLHPPGLPQPPSTVHPPVSLHPPGLPQPP